MTNLWITADELGSSYSTSEYAEDAVRTASYILWGMSGRKYTGTTTVTERYFTSIDAFRYQGASAKTFFPHLIAGEAVNVPTEDWNDSAYQSDGTSSLSRIRLRGKPVQEVHLVRSLYNGNIVPEDTYYVAEHSMLVGYKGTPWPPGNIEVTYTYGSRPPAAGRQAAKLLAEELIKLWSGDDDCMLPQRVTSVSRQGVSFTILDNQEFLNELRIGIYAVDLFLKTTNPNKALLPSKIWNPDVPRARRAAPARAVTLTPSSTYDVALTKLNSWTVSQVHACTGALASLAAYNTTGFTLELAAYSYAGSVEKIYPVDAAEFSVVDGTTYINLTFTYGTTYQAIGPSDPGTWVLRAKDVDDGSTVDLLEGNLQIKKVVQSQVNPQGVSTGTPTKFICQQGATFSKVINWSIDGIPVDLTGYTAAMQVRTSYTAAAAELSLVSTAGAAKVISSAVVASNVATVTTASAHGLTSGSTITVYNLTAGSGSVKYVVISAPTSNTFTIAYTASNGSLTLGTSPTSTLNAGITLGGGAGTITITVDAAHTAELDVATYVYDLELTSSSSVVTRLLEGKFVVTPESTMI